MFAWLLSARRRFAALVAHIRDRVAAKLHLPSSSPGRRRRGSTRLVAVTRIRNESLVIRDTIEHLESFCDGIIVYDDCSTDDTVELVERHSKKLLQLIRGDSWRPDRTAEETRHRAILYRAAQSFGAEWVFCVDADERFEGDIRALLSGRQARGFDGVRVQLFDGYLTADHAEPYGGGDLASTTRLYGPERRDILMIWRNSPLFFYEGLDLREPRYRAEARIITADIYCKHFGKSLSVEHWEETCDYYIRHFPEPYKTKWRSRKGKAIHDVSDFGFPLYGWDEVRRHGMEMHPRDDVAARIRELEGQG